MSVGQSSAPGARPGLPSGFLLEALGPINRVGWGGAGQLVHGVARACLCLQAGGLRRQELVGQGWRTAAGAQGPPTCYQPVSGGQTQGKRVASRQKLLARCSFTEPCPKWVPLDGEQPCWLAQDRRGPRLPADLRATVTYSPEVSRALPEASSARWGRSAGGGWGSESPCLQGGGGVRLAS